tara:strand:+ start:1969 stop:3306 length:1338 start_codon:yes stop_codon:yes gene_type:complete
MCGIFVSNKSEINEKHKFLIEKRGPDHLESFNRDNFNIYHSLLSMTGDFTIQPVRTDKITVLFNGEIYNYLNDVHHPSDIYKIIDTYEKYNESFLNYLDGEFAIILFDHKKKKLLFSSDIFGSKPLYYSLNEHYLGISTYPELLRDQHYSHIQKCEPNSLYIYDLETNNLEIIRSNYKFELKQFKKNFEDWNYAFLNSVEKRFNKTKFDIILPLSSGHDSGAIACALNVLGIPYTSYSFSKNEDMNIIEKRIELKESENLGKSYLVKDLTEKERSASKKFIEENCSEFFYGPDLNYENKCQDGVDDPGAHGLTHILSQVKRDNINIRILASGQGGDEIMSTIQSYNFGSPNPKKFPRNIKKVFPWQNFFYGAQSSYLSKEENIAGSFGIESRYPLLDKEVVQEFLLLNHHLKNKMFKSPLANFMQFYDYPYLKGVGTKIKKGFNV